MTRNRPLWILAALSALTLGGLYPNSAAAMDRLCDTRIEDCRAQLLTLINNEPASGGIDVAFWFMTDDRYRAALQNAFNRGVRVRVLMDPRANDTKAGNATELDRFQAGGIPMRMKVAKSWSDILHWKMMHFESQGVVEFSAANYTDDSFVPQTPEWNYIDEVVYYTDDTRLVGSFRTKFEDFWTDTTGNFVDYANITGPQSRYYPVVTQDPALNFPPTQDYMVKATTHYKREYGLPGAKFDVIMYRISDARSPDVMIEAFTNYGIPVRVITEQENYRDDRYIWHAYNVDRMWAAGIDVKDHVGGKLGIVHQKSVILYGQKEVIFGSSNWSTASANQQVEHNLFSLPCKAGQTTWCDTNNWFFNWFVNQFETKWNQTDEFKPFVPLPGGTPVNAAPANGASGLGTSTVTLKWDGGNWNHKYDVYFGTNPSSLTRIATDIIVGSPYTGKYETFDVSNLAPGTTYYWYVVGKTMASGARAQAAGLNLDKPGPLWSFTTSGVSSGSTPYGGTPAPIPGRIQAENFDDGGQGVAYSDTTPGNTGNVYRSTDVDIAAMAGGGGYYVGWTRANEYVKFTTNVQSDGTYRLDVRVANKGTGARFHVNVDGVDVTGQLTVPDTGGYETFQTVSKPGITLTAGTHAVRLFMDAVSTQGGAGNFDWLEFSPDSQTPQDPTPYGGVAWPVPGTIQAENFDEGGAGIAYYDTTTGNNGNVYRSTDVDIAALSGGGYYVGWTRAGEWMKYTASVQANGSYTLDARLANKGTGAKFHVEVDGVNVTGSLAVPDTGAYETFQLVTKTGIPLTAGSHVVRFFFETVSSAGGAGNLDWLRFTAESTQPPPSSTPYGGTAAAVPGRIDIERFDEGGSGVAYADTTTGNAGGDFRQTDVDVDVATDTGGGYYVGWTRAGEWLNYTVSIASDGTYTLSLRVANKGTGAKVHLEADGVDVSGPIDVPDTGGWQTWTTITAPSPVSLTAGQHVLRLKFDTATPANGGVGNWNWMQIQ